MICPNDKLVKELCNNPFFTILIYTGTIIRFKNDHWRVANKLDKNSGYEIVYYKDKTLKVHRIIFFYKHRYLPVYVDHEDTNKRNNHIDNLRELSARDNLKNRRKMKEFKAKYGGD